ncbi:MAG: type II 3-dehydroquinate dehydratase [Eubacteriales bacterium]|jgi:3-dehydroquinate dehydratase-2|nr:type II 3-dehydroquinate dehydratase [Eubacteriales bacterium]
MKIIVIHGPNLNMLGTREPHIYGSETLEDINEKIRKYAKSLSVEADFFQSNCEGEIISKIQGCQDKYDAAIINAGAYTHYSYAIRDAIAAVSIPFVEVHMSNVYAREDFRHKSVISPVCKGMVCGFGSNSYLAAISALTYK